jgi:hypothetical protein
MWMFGLALDEYESICRELNEERELWRAKKE